MHAPHRTVTALLLIAPLCLWTACGKKSAPTAPRANPPVCSVNPTNLDFGTVAMGSPTDLHFTIKNTGGGTLSGTLSDTSSVFTLVGTKTYSLAAGDTADFLVRFTPKTLQATSCTIGTGSALCGTVSCSGTGIPAEPECYVFPQSQTLSFGNVQVNGGSAQQVLFITNVGGGVLSGRVSVDTGEDFVVTGERTPGTSYALTNGQTATFLVYFTPFYTGAQSCSLSTGNGQCGKVYVTATGVPPANASLDYLDFGSVSVGQTVQRTFTISTSLRCGSNPYGLCTRCYNGQFVVVGDVDSGAGYRYRCDTHYQAVLPVTYTVNFTPTSVGPQRTTIEVQCESAQSSGYGITGYVNCRGVGI